MRILVTGGFGFLGNVVRQKLQAANHEPLRFHHRDFDLLLEDQIRSLLRHAQPNIVIHAAANVGGIEYNRKNGGQLLWDNLQMGMNVINACASNEVKKLIMIGSVCAYPGDLPVPISEADLWKGRPEESNAGYGLAKRMLIELGEARTDLRVVNLVLANLYGPGDNFDPNRSHVVPALIRKFCEAAKVGAGSVECWGSGRATRDLLYVDDAADAILAAVEKETSPGPINVATGVMHSISTIAAEIKRLTGFQGKIFWNALKPDGQMERCYQVQRARGELDWMSKIGISEGLRKTVEWYCHSCAE